MCRVLNFLKALLSRLLFAAHGLGTVYCVTEVKGESFYWLLTGVALLAVEMPITIKYTRNMEWKRFSPMVFLYLSTVIPSIWFLELHLLESNPTSTPTPTPTPAEVQVDPKTATAAVEQTMLIVLVLGRWLMPKGDMSRDQLSQLLLANVALGADILGIFDTFKNKEVKTSHALIIVGLSLCTGALMQFPLTQTSRPKLHGESQTPETRPGLVPRTSSSCCSSEVWNHLLTVGLQDGPLLVYRLYVLIQKKFMEDQIFFFTCKNILSVMLNLYRICVVHCKSPRCISRSHDTAQEQSERVESEVLETSSQV